MELTDKVVVVTGGASGIGAALCRRFDRAGARGVVVADRDGAGATRVAEEIGGLAVVTDVTREAQVRALVEQARERFGPIDLFFSNAGVALGGGMDLSSAGPFAPDEAWQTSWDVNVMAHVFAARAVLPGMLERGSGAIVSTASAAGLLTDLSSQAYSVTKHAAVAFAEWLAIHTRGQGIHVACLCPQGVNTPMLAGAAAAASGAPHLTQGALEPEDVAEAVIAGLAAETFLILPHPEVADYLQRKTGDPDRWLAGMHKLKGRLYG